MEVDSQFEAPPTALDSPSAATQNEPENGKNASPSKQPNKRAKLESTAKPTAASGAAGSRRKVRDVRPSTDLEVPPSATLGDMGTVATEPSPLLVPPARANPSVRFKPTLKISPNRSKLAVLLG